MLRIEDKELENMVLSGNSVIAVPVDIYCSAEGECEITVYSCIENIIEEFAKQYEGNLFSADAINRLDELLYATVKEFGYVHSDESIHHTYEFYIDNAEKLNKYAEKSNVRIIDANTDLNGIDTGLINDFYINDKAAVIIEDNKIVSVACENDISFDDDSIEVFVETDEEYRNKGYGCAAVCAFAEYYLKSGITVRYKCSVDNKASIALAAKCGFERGGERYSYVCYAIDE